jgi:hypothetical protein
MAQRQSHAEQRAVERYGQELSMRLVAQIVQGGQANAIAPGHQGCTFYDVPYKRHAGGRGPEVVRVLMSPDKCHVITVIHTQTPLPVQAWKNKLKKMDDQNGQRKKAFFRGFESDEEDCVTV